MNTCKQKGEIIHNSIQFNLTNSLTQYVVSAALPQSSEFCPLQHSAENCSDLPITSSKHVDEIRKCQIKSLPAQVYVMKCAKSENRK